MSYVNKNLMTNEKVKFTAKIHWLILLPGIATIVISIIMMNSPTADSGVAAIILLFGLWMLVKALISKITTELVVTNKRVIAKVGLIRRDTIELNHSKVESYQIKQPILGRILGYGTVIINGTGGGKTPIPNIDSPMDFRRFAMEAVDQLQSA
jgi:uncharacterized membrane protein YdbT with pleckstrin-like domain